MRKNSATDAFAARPPAFLMVRSIPCVGISCSERLDFGGSYSLFIGVMSCTYGSLQRMVMPAAALPAPSTLPASIVFFCFYLPFPGARRASRILLTLFRPGWCAATAAPARNSNDWMMMLLPIFQVISAETGTVGSALSSRKRLLSAAYLLGWLPHGDHGRPVVAYLPAATGLTRGGCHRLCVTTRRAPLGGCFYMRPCCRYFTFVHCSPTSLSTFTTLPHHAGMPATCFLLPLHAWFFRRRRDDDDDACQYCRCRRAFLVHDCSFPRPRKGDRQTEPRRGRCMLLRRYTVPGVGEIFIFQTTRAKGMKTRTARLLLFCFS